MQLGDPVDDRQAEAPATVLRSSRPHESLDDDDDTDYLRAWSPAAAPARTSSPSNARSSRALAGIERLPATLRDAMVLRVVEERPTAAVCAVLGLSEENLFVRVHRARKRLVS